MLLGFKPRFEEPIQLGTKVFTLRGKRKNEPKLGETLYMYTGLRTSNCRKISDKEKLQDKQRVRLQIRANAKNDTLKVWVDGRELTEAEIDQFVIYDGFVDRTDFINYWIQDKTEKPRRPKKAYRIGAFLTMYHWTDLKY
jgi:hypothetical protein